LCACLSTIAIAPVPRRPRRRIAEINDRSKIQNRAVLPPWTKCVLSDMETLKIQTFKDLETKSKKREHFKMISSAYSTESSAFIDSHHDPSPRFV